MNRFSARERRLIVVFAVVLALLVGVLVLGGGDDVIEVPDLGLPTPSAVVPVVPTTSPSFAVPPGARDPFGGSGA